MNLKNNLIKTVKSKNINHLFLLKFCAQAKAITPSKKEKQKQ